MQVIELWRHPVKSLRGEQLTEMVVEASGAIGDREWGIRDETTGNILTGRREPPLLLASSRLTIGGEAEITLPDGRVLTGPDSETDTVLSEWLGRRVRLVPAVGSGSRVAEYFEDAADDTSQALTFTMPAGHFVDAFPLLLLTTSSLRQGAELHPGGTWDVRRFRPNVVIEGDAVGWVEDGWTGKRIRLGEVELQGQAPCERCTMVTRPQPGLDRDLDVYRALARSHDGTFGVWSSVVTLGTIRRGDEVTVVEAELSDH
ncbi:MAG: MOSC N-terminal beta barrel domain-containing protein [Acidimicrobiales bacterium]